MSVEVFAGAGGRILELHVSGKLEEQDYEYFVPLMESQMESHGRIRLLIRLRDFEGWTAGALWEDLKLVRHVADVDRLAFVGEHTWEAGMAKFCKPFTTAEVKYFDSEQEAEARRWIEDGLVDAAADS